MKDKPLSHITGDAVKAALDDFSLKFASGWDHEILAIEVREALAGTILPETRDPARLSNAEIREGLAKLANAARALNSRISSLHPLSDRRLIESSFKRDGFTNFIGFIFSESSQYFRFREVSSQLTFIAEFLESVASNTERQAPRWRDSEQRLLRIWRGERLIPVFESAFGGKITLNGWPSDPRHNVPTPFMEFYQRMVKLSFGEEKTQDLSGILNEARKSLR